MKLLLILIFTFSSIYSVDLFKYINKKNCNQIIDKQVYIICYDYQAKGAKYVSYTLDANKVNSVNIKKRASFYTEKQLPKRYRSHTKDYVNTGYDRGHLASDASFDYDKKILRKTYSMANIIPQSPSINRRVWIKVEKFERHIALKLGKVSVINGVIYSKNPKRIGKNKIAVPNAFWKIIYNNKKHYKKCFLYKNNLLYIDGDKLKNHLIDCNELIFK